MSTATAAVPASVIKVLVSVTCNCLLLVMVVGKAAPLKITANNNGGAVMIHLGAEDFLLRYKLYVTHIAEWKQQFQNLHSIDLRYDGQIIVNPDANQAAPPAAEQTPAPPAVKPAAKPVRHRAWKKK